METNVIMGFALVLLGAIGGGSYALPSKFASKWPWEITWGLFFFFATICLPIVMGATLVQDAFAIWRQAGMQVLIWPILFGFIWGFGSMTLGIGFSMIGLSLAYAINFGLQTGFGSLLPMVLLSPEHFGTPAGNVIVMGIALCVVGVVACGYAGILKDRGAKAAVNMDENRKSSMMVKGIVITVISGLICPCVNLGFSYGGQIITIAHEDYGHPIWRATLAVWMLTFVGGAISSCGYCIYLLFRNRTWSSFTKPNLAKVLLIGLLMAVLHDGCLVVYGMGAQYLGVLGTSVGFAVFLSGIILTGNVHGFLTGEWRGVNKKAVTWILAGVVIIVIAMAVLGKGNAMLAVN